MTSSNPISNIYKFVGTNFVLNLNIIIGFGDFWKKKRPLQKPGNNILLFSLTKNTNTDSDTELALVNSR